MQFSMPQATTLQPVVRQQFHGAKVHGRENGQEQPPRAIMRI